MECMNTGAAGNRIDQDKQYRNPLVWRSRQHIADPRKRPNERCIDNKNYFRDEIHLLVAHSYAAGHDEKKRAGESHRQHCAEMLKSSPAA